MKPTTNKSELKFLILKILEKKYASADEIIELLSSEKIYFDTGTFYPSLSNLQIRKLLCSNWLKNNGGQNIKYYHLTRNGLDYLYNITN